MPSLERAEQVCRDGQANFPDDKELLFRQAMLYHRQGRLKDAVSAYQQVLSDSGRRHFTSIDVGLAGFKTHYNLALVFEDLGEFHKAECEWRAAVDQAPLFAQAWRCLGELFIRQDRFAEVDALLSQFDQQPDLKAERLLLAAKLAERIGHYDEAERLLMEADSANPADLTAHRRRCQLLFEHGDCGSARNELRRLTIRVPEDASAWQNFGAICWRLGDLSTAESALRESLRLRPNSADAESLLREVLWESQNDSSSFGLQRSPEVSNRIPEFH